MFKDNYFNTDDVDFGEEETPSENIENNNENLFNSPSGGNNGGNKPPKKPNLKIIGIVISGVLLLLLFLMLTLGKLNIVKDNNNSIVPKDDNSEVVNSTYESSSLLEDTEESSFESSVEDNSIKDTSTSNNQNSNSEGLVLQPSFDSIGKDFYETKGEIKDISLYEDSDLKVAQYMLTIRFYDENDEEDYTIFLTSHNSANKLSIGTVINMSYQRTAKKGNIILNSISIEEDEK